MFKEKIRPNVIWLGTACLILTGFFGYMLIQQLGSSVSNEVLALLVGIGLGSMVSVVASVATDPPPPNVPAHVVEKMLDMSCDPCHPHDHKHDEL